MDDGAMIGYNGTIRHNGAMLDGRMDGVTMEMEEWMMQQWKMKDREWSDGWKDERCSED